MAFERNKALIAKRFGQRAQVYDSVTPVQKRMAEHLVSLVDQRFSKEPTKKAIKQLSEPILRRIFRPQQQPAKRWAQCERNESRKRR